MKRYRMGARGQLATLFLGDAVAALRRLPAQSVHCCITSPPYYGLRDYGVDGQIGLEETPDAYVARLVEVFREVRRVLRNDSVLWLNLGDSYVNLSGGCGGQGATSQRKGRANVNEQRRAMAPGHKPKDLLGIPWRVAFALQADGWLLRSACPWVKRNPLPESVTDRPGTAHEYVFLLAKESRYFYDAEAVKVKAIRAGDVPGGNRKVDGFRNDAGRDMTIPVAAARNCRTSDWWFDSLRAILAGESSAVTDEEGDMLAFPVNSKGFKGSHFAVMPEALVEPCILAGTSAKGCCPTCGSPWGRVVERGDVPVTPRRKRLSATQRQGHPDYQEKARPSSLGAGVGGDVPCREVVTKGWQPSCNCPAADPVPCTVLDPFLGSGTVAAVALHLGRSAIGIDLNEEYLGLAKQRVGEAVRKVKFRRATLL